MPAPAAPCSLPYVLCHRRCLFTAQLASRRRLPTPQPTSRTCLGTAAQRALRVRAPLWRASSASAHHVPCGLPLLAPVRAPAMPTSHYEEEAPVTVYACVRAWLHAGRRKKREVEDRRGAHACKFPLPLRAFPTRAVCRCACASHMHACLICWPHVGIASHRILCGCTSCGLSCDFGSTNRIAPRSLNSTDTIYSI